MDPITNVRDISRIAYGFMASKALFAALNLGVFEVLAKGPRNLEVLANETGLQHHRLFTLLTALVSLGVLAKEDSLYSNCPAAGRYLVRGEPAYFGDYYRYQIDRLIYPGMENLEQALAGEPLHGLYNHAFEDASEAEDFTRGQHSGSKGPAFLLARSVDLSDCRKLLDVGGGSGAFSLAFCRENPDLSATILDFPNVVCHAETFAKEEGLSGRIKPLSGNALETPWPEGQDVVLMSYLLSAVPRPAVAELLRRAMDALSPGGRLLLHDFTVAEDGTGPHSVVRSFRPLRAEERELIQRTQLSVAKARAGETLEELNTRTGNVWSAQETAVSNSLSIDTRLEEGQLVKIASRSGYEAKPPPLEAEEPAPE